MASSFLSSSEGENASIARGKRLKMYNKSNYRIRFFVICKIINLSVRVIWLAFGSADNSYLDIDNSAYHKNLIQ